MTSLEYNRSPPTRKSFKGHDYESTLGGRNILKFSGQKSLTLLLLKQRRLLCKLDIQLVARPNIWSIQQAFSHTVLQRISKTTVTFLRAPMFQDMIFWGILVSIFLLEGKGKLV